MARLNEPLVSTDSADILRRKFMRQNRALAATNSAQSLKIRHLENEYARMITENLELRSHILRLEEELKESRTQRIADHALEIKAQMEAQLVQWGTMLASLGNEPAPRHRSPRATKKARRTSNFGPPSQWKRRDSMDIENAAMLENRLPPIWETKPYPRETLNREEILAICSEATEANESPDLGPPPVSRFIAQDPVKLSLPSRSISESPSTQKTPSSPVKKPVLPESRSAESRSSTVAMRPKEEASRPEPTKPEKEQLGKTKEHVAAPIIPSHLQVASDSAKPCLKRKSREEDEKANSAAPKQPAPTNQTVKPHADKPAVLKEQTSSRPIKQIPLVKKDAATMKTSGGAAAAQRKPLGAKSSNDNLKSPKKAAKPATAALDDITKAKAEGKRDDATKQRPKQKREGKDLKEPSAEAESTVVVVQPQPPAEPAPVAQIEVESEPMFAEQNSMPASPEISSSFPSEEVTDTPPPFDISSRGETTRGSRRNRGAVSYAEPNLRDKMRRPTKQLLDAVTGEGKSRRSSQSQKDELPTPASSVMAKSDSRPSAHGASGSSGFDHDGPASPLAQKSSRPAPTEDLPTSVVTDRRKRGSSISGQGLDVDSSSTKPAANKPTNRRLDEIAAREAAAAKMYTDSEGEGSSSDVYDLNFSSPPSSPKQKSKGSEDSKPAKGSKARGRRLSSVTRDDLPTPESSSAENGHNSAFSDKPTGRAAGRKQRASMTAAANAIRNAKAPAATSALEDQDDSYGRLSPVHLDADEGADAEAGAAGSKKGRVGARRKSMMV